MHELSFVEDPGHEDWVRCVLRDGQRFSTVNNAACLKTYEISACIQQHYSYIFPLKPFVKYNWNEVVAALNAL